MVLSSECCCWISVSVGVFNVVFHSSDAGSRQAHFNNCSVRSDFHYSSSVVFLQIPCAVCSHHEVIAVVCCARKRNVDALSWVERVCHCTALISTDNHCIVAACRGNVECDVADSVYCLRAECFAASSAAVV